MIEPLSPFKSRRHPVQAGLQIENSSSLRAWVEFDDPTKLIPVEVIIDDRVFWTGRPRRLEHLRFDPDVPRTPCGLWVDLPAPKTKPHIIDIKLVAEGNILVENAVDLAQRYRGFVDLIELTPEGLLIEGWAHDFSRPLSPLELELCAGNHKILFTAGRFREDLKKGNVGLGMHAFSERVRRSSLTGSSCDDVRVCIAGTEIVLPSSDFLQNVAKTAAPPPGETREISPAANRVLLAIVPEETSKSKIIGTCDNIGRDDVRGWALDVENKDQPVVVDLLINNIVAATTVTDRSRPDVAAKHGGNGYAGFYFEIIPQVWLGKDLNVAVVARKSGQALAKGTGALRPTFTKYLPHQPNCHAGNRSTPLFAPERHRRGNSQASVALIVLNYNGAALLERHFSSFAAHNTHRNVEYVVVDHGSTDDSQTVIKKWQSAGIPITLIERGDNYSFSASNNYAVQYTKADYLLFCNNDVFFTQDSLPAFMDVLVQDDVGIAGVRLVDEIKSDDEPGFGLIQHLGVFYDTVRYDNVIHPVEARYLPILREALKDDISVPAVTGAFLGIKRKDFEKVGGFYEGYYYGYEDIDLCLRIRLNLNKSIVMVGTTELVHSRGYSRKRTGFFGGKSMMRNCQLLAGRFGLALRRLLRSRGLAEQKFWTASKPIVAFAVSEARTTTAKGDFYTAHGLAEGLSELLDAEFVFLEEKQNWYDLREVDVLVAMTHAYNLELVQRAKQNLVTVGWARNWFTEWSKARRHQFDFLLSSSAKGAEIIRNSLGHPVEVFRIATSPSHFYPDPTVEKTVDYVFTGSFWQRERDLIYLLEPAALPYSCEIYGAGWDQVESLAPYAKGLVAYSDLADIYRRARIVVDDANSVTKSWGSVNSRVFDAISAGALVITNSQLASEDAFDGKLPWFHNREELEGLLHRYCGNEEERIAALAPLQEMVRERHVVSTRARQFISILDAALPKMLRIAIKVPCPSEKEAPLWGDYHFAQSLAKELRALGHSVRLDLLNEWAHANRLRDDAVICLRGLNHYSPTPDHINVCWLISHPTSASLDELRKYDRVYVASQKYCALLQLQGLTNVETLLQCVDTDLFRWQSEREKEFDVLFVGNSRNVLRPIVRDALSVNAPLSIIGSGWDELLPRKMVLQPSIPNVDLPDAYAAARVVLNDHWSSMAEHGLISNRLFDCVASGTYVISDYVEGISDLFGPLVQQYRSPDELRALIDKGLQRASVSENDREMARAISEANSFKARAKTISGFLIGSFEEVCRQRLESPPGPR
jgi:GT2 family glycosyltransferase/spore maturation protein CgeB